MDEQITVNSTLDQQYKTFATRLLVSAARLSHLSVPPPSVPSEVTESESIRNNLQVLINLFKAMGVRNVMEERPSVEVIAKQMRQIDTTELIANAAKLIRDLQSEREELLGAEAQVLDEAISNITHAFAPIIVDCLSEKYATDDAFPDYSSLQTFRASMGIQSVADADVEFVQRVWPILKKPAMGWFSSIINWWNKEDLLVTEVVFQAMRMIDILEHSPFSTAVGPLGVLAEEKIKKIQSILAKDSSAMFFKLDPILRARLTSLERSIANSMSRVIAVEMFSSSFDETQDSGAPNLIETKTLSSISENNEEVVQSSADQPVVAQGFVVENLPGEISTQTEITASDSAQTHITDLETIKGDSVSESRIPVAEQQEAMSPQLLGEKLSENSAREKAADNEKSVTSTTISEELYSADFLPDEMLLSEDLSSVYSLDGDLDVSDEQIRLEANSGFVVAANEVADALVKNLAQPHESIGRTSSPKPMLPVLSEPTQPKLKSGTTKIKKPDGWISYTVRVAEQEAAAEREAAANNIAARSVLPTVVKSTPRKSQPSQLPSASVGAKHTHISKAKPTHKNEGVTSTATKSSVKATPVAAKRNMPIANGRTHLPGSIQAASATKPKVSDTPKPSTLHRGAAAKTGPGKTVIASNSRFNFNGQNGSKTHVHGKPKSKPKPKPTDKVGIQPQKLTYGC